MNEQIWVSSRSNYLSPLQGNHMTALDGIGLEVGIAGIIGFILGSLIVYSMNKETTNDDEKVFRAKEFEKWHLREDWLDILVEKKGKPSPREIAIEELTKIDEILTVRNKEYEQLKQEQRTISEEYRTVIEDIKNEKTPAVRLLAAQGTLSAITARGTQYRKRSEDHVNAIVPIQWRKQFLQLVRDENPRKTIRDTMNSKDLAIQIKDNQTKQLDFLHSELDALTGGNESGTRDLLTKLFGDIF